MAAGRIYGPSWGRLRAGVESGFALKKQWFLHMFIKICEKHLWFSMLDFGGQCSRFISNNTIWAPPVLPRRVARVLPKSFRRVKNCLCSGAPLGSQAAAWRPFLDSSCCISGLGSFLGSFLIAFGVSGMYLGIFFGLL